MNAFVPFFATEQDLALILEPLEREVDVRYVLMGSSAIGARLTLSSHRQLPGLGLATADSSFGSDAYLLLPRRRRVGLRAIADQVFRPHRIDERANPKSVVLAPGGLWGPDVMLHGYASLRDGDSQAQAIMRQLLASIGGAFRQVETFWVGPEADRSLASGMRITAAVASPASLDLLDANPRR